MPARRNNLYVRQPQSLSEAGIPPTRIWLTKLGAKLFICVQVRTGQFWENFAPAVKPAAVRPTSSLRLAVIVTHLSEQDARSIQSITWLARGKIAQPAQTTTRARSGGRHRQRITYLLHLRASEGARRVA